ncbi:hypothetical protein [Saccharopolyspora montiporae]|uniref:hypothetical protein n=1 Tax=Saccharopolyspora montiporae TaxID=2781240 RepID=UPI003F88378F
MTAQVAALGEIGEQINGLVGSVSRLAESMPMLGTAPPAMHLAMRLREAAGEAGLTAEIGTADTELNGFHSALQAAVTDYVATDETAARGLHNTGGAQSC